MIAYRQFYAKQKGAIRAPKKGTQITPVLLTAPCSIQNAKSGIRYSIVRAQNYLSILYHIFTFFLADFVARIVYEHNIGSISDRHSL